MLVLSRKESDRILIGDEIEILIVRVGKSGQVRIGISAPESFRIKRPETDPEGGDGGLPGDQPHLALL